MDNSKNNQKSTDNRHKRKVFDLRFQHIKVVCLLSVFAVSALVISLILHHQKEAFWSSIFANIFAGLLTGLVICLISGINQNAIAKLEAELVFLNELISKTREFQEEYNKLLKKSFSKFDNTDELFDFIYGVGARANWINEFILQGSFNDMLALDPVQYCKAFGYDALALSQVNEELHQHLYLVDVNCPTKKEILDYFIEVEKALRHLRSAAFDRKSEVEITLERIKYSLF